MALDGALTTGIVGRIFGLRYLATLFGFVFLSHQLGSSSGLAGGPLFDATGSYDGIWWAGSSSASPPRSFICPSTTGPSHAHARPSRRRPNR